MMNFVAKDDREIRKLCSKLTEQERKTVIAYLRGMTDGRGKQTGKEQTSR